MNTVRCFWCMCQELLCECCLPCARVVWVVLRVGSCCHSVPLLSLKRLVMLMDLKMMCVALITAKTYDSLYTCVMSLVGIPNTKTRASRLRGSYSYVMNSRWAVSISPTATPASATATQIHNPIAKMRRKKMHTGYDIDDRIGRRPLGVSVGCLSYRSTVLNSAPVPPLPRCLPASCCRQRQP